MTRKKNLAYSLSVLIIFLLSLPMLQFFFPLIHEKQLFGYVGTTSYPPSFSLQSWLNRDLQKHWEDLTQHQLGFRGLLIKLYNDINFRLFHEQMRTDLVATKEHGLYLKTAILHIK